MARQLNESEHPDVMVSSTYRDLVEHRAATIDALLRLGFFPIGMEFNSSIAGKKVVAASLGMVKRARAYVGIISHRYGGVPIDAKANPEELSVTELEYRKAINRRIPVYMFLMSREHKVTVENVESVDAYRQKLEALRADARANSICAEFSSVEMLKSLILQSMAELMLNMKGAKSRQSERSTKRATHTRLPAPPALVALPDFISGHPFVGRESELAWLDEWAASGDPLLIIEAIGGTGKSTLSWQWTNTRAQHAIPNLRGRFWYSFYDAGADMAAFAASALAYSTKRPIEEFRRGRTRDLARALQTELQDKTFLFVLDGLERTLVAYDRFDASQARDDEISVTSDHCDCTKPADADFLRELLAFKSSKFLLTSRLMPTALMNTSTRALPGAQHRYLRGMHPDDALAMMRGLTIHGDESAIRRYLTENFDNHPLIVGVVGGLVADYPRDPGNFDRWASDPHGGALLHLSKLDLKRRRTHILATALNGLEPDARRLLSYTAALGYAVPFETIVALEPLGPDRSLPRLVSALQRLERRGLLQWDRKNNNYDLHPVVRGYVFDILERAELTDISNRIVDHFEGKPSDQYAKVKTLADVQQSVTILRALIHADRIQDAADFFVGDFATALLFAVEAHEEVLELLTPMFPNGFQSLPLVDHPQFCLALLCDVGIALQMLGRLADASGTQNEALRFALAEGSITNVATTLCNLASVHRDENRLAQATQALEFAADIELSLDNGSGLASVRALLIDLYATLGYYDRAEEQYTQFRQLPEPPWSYYRAGSAELSLCWSRLDQGILTPEFIDEAETAVRRGGNRMAVRGLCNLKGEWFLLNGDTLSAMASFERAIELARAVGARSLRMEARLALAKVRAGDHPGATEICKRISSSGKAPHISLAEVYLELRDHDQALQQAIEGYKEAWADGPPYCSVLDLMRCRAILAILAATEPELPPFDPTRVAPIPFETEIRALIAAETEGRA